MERNKRPKRVLRSVYLIIVDGETEKWYLDLMKEKESLRHLRIDPELCKKRTLKEQFQVIEENLSVYPHIIWIIDFDVILKESTEKKKGEKPKAAEFWEYYEKLTRYPNIHILINTPCLEFWYLLHLKDTGKYYASYTELEKEFKHTLLDGYKKTEKFYKQSANDIYTKLKPYLEDALSRARRLGEVDREDMEKGKAEIYKLFHLLKNS